jgi:hypothetical protein
MLRIIYACLKYHIIRHHSELAGPSNGLRALFASPILQANRRTHPSVSTTCHANSTPNLKSEMPGKGIHLSYSIHNTFTYLLFLAIFAQDKMIVHVPRGTIRRE